jgi:hypothetical protein
MNSPTQRSKAGLGAAEWVKSKLPFISFTLLTFKPPYHNIKPNQRYLKF